MASYALAGRGVNTRAKGVRFEREVADVFTAAGFAVRGLEAIGDHLILRRDGLVLSSECKRREKLSIGAWWKQTVADAPDGAVPLLTFRQARGEMLSLVRTEDLVRLIARASS